MNTPPVQLAGADEMEAFGAELGRRLKAGDVITLYGDLGAGKTTLVRGVLSGLGWNDEVASPTFPIMLNYEPPECRIPVWHIDLYRIEDEEELEELGLDDLRKEAALLIEWPERMGARLWRDAMRITISSDGPDSRLLTAQCPPAWEDRWPI